MRQRFLYVTHRVPWPPDRGDRIRTWNILKFLAARADVDLLCLSDEPVTDETINVLRRYTKQLAIIPHSGPQRYLSGLLSLAAGRSITEGMFASRQAARTLQQWVRTTRWNAALCSSSGVAQYIAPDLLGTSIRRWVDLIDVDSQKWLDFATAAQFPLRQLYQLEGRRLRAAECQLARECERLLVVSEAERRLFHEFCPTDRMIAVGNGVDTDYFAPRPDAEVQSNSAAPCCVFVGVMNYLPNVDAVRWFAAEVWPGIRQHYPDAVFRIVGRLPAANVLALADLPGIEVLGPVADIRPWLHQAQCIVVPLRIARGIQNKVLEGMACGRPVICSSAPLQGLSAEPGLHLLRADSVAEWVQTVCHVFGDRALQHDLGLAASVWVTSNHCWESCLEPLCDLLQPTNDSSLQVLRSQPALYSQSEADT